MKRFLFSIICLLFLAGRVIAQDPCYEWSHGWGVNTIESVVTSDDSGNVYVAVTFHYTVDFDPGPGVQNLTSHPGGTFPRMDIAIIKLDTNDEVVWIKQITGDASGKFPSDIVVKDGYLYISGQVSGGPTDFDPSGNTAISNGLHNAGFVTKWTVNGTYEWHVRFESDFSAPYVLNDEALSVDVDDDQNVLVSGYFVDTMDIDPDPINTHFLYGEYIPDDPTGFVAKYDVNGALQWGYSLASQNINEARSVGTDSLGNVYVTGRFEGTTDFDPGVGQYNLTSVPISEPDMFIQKISPNGGLIWAYRIGNTFADATIEIEVQPNGDFYIFGEFAGTMDADPGLGITNLQANGEHDVFVSRFNSDGELIWAERFGGPGYDAALELQQDQLGDLYLAGTYRDSVEFEPNSGEYFFTEGLASAFILKLTDQGSFEWVTTYANEEWTRAHSLAITPSSDVYMVGRSEDGVLDMDPGPDSSFLVGEHIFLLKLQQCNIQYITDSVTACDEYFWPYSSALYTQSGSYLQVGEDLLGCDSIVTLALEVNYSSTAFQTDTACDAYTWSVNNSTISASGIYIDTIQNLAGCDSVVTLDLIVNFSDSTMVEEEACQSFFWDASGTSYTISGSYSFASSNTAGCDSTSTLQLTVLPLDTNVLELGDSLIAAPNQNYQWLRCDSNGYVILPDDTNMVFVPEENGSYAVVITNDPCQDTTTCFEVNTLGLHSSLTGLDIQVLQEVSVLRVSGQGKALSFQEVSLWNSLGQRLMWVSKSGQNNVELRTPPASGIYIIQCVLTDGSVVMEKVFLQGF